MAVRMFINKIGHKCLFVTSVSKLERLQFLRLNRFHIINALNGDAVKISMPSLSPTMQQGTIIKWYKKEGESVSPGDLLCDIQTDKAVVGFEVEEEGVLAKILKPENSANVEVGSLIALIVEKEADWKNVVVPDDAVKDVAAPTNTSTTLPIETITAVHQHATDIHTMGPAVRLLLEQYAIKPGSVPATGPSHRLLKGDVLSYVKTHNLSPVPLGHVPLPASTTPVVSATPIKVSKAVETKVVTKGNNFIDIELTSMRSVIAKRLSLSKQTIPHSYSTIECSIGKLMVTRKHLAEEGVKVGVNDFIIKAAALALQKVPEANAVWSGDTSRLLSNIDISIAVATDNGLITPIVKNANALDVSEIAATVKDLATRARAGKLKLDEFQGGSFTISNLGMFGITSFSAVINPPQACILAVGAGQTVLRLNDEDGSVSTSTVVPVTLSCDARMVDDSVAAAFLATLRDVLENPMLMLGNERSSSSATPPRYELQKLFAK